MSLKGGPVTNNVALRRRAVSPGTPATADTIGKRTTAVHHTGRRSRTQYVTPEDRIPTAHARDDRR